MGRSSAAKRRNKNRHKRIKLHDAKGYLTRGVNIPTAIPEIICAYCKQEESMSDDIFDANGYKIPKTIVGSGSASHQNPKPIENLKSPTEDGWFRFLDLPPEIRNRIYELVVYKPNQPVCVPDRLLRPSKDLNDARNVLRLCRSEVICLPCQLHKMLGTGDIGLSRANKQLHFEMSLITYGVNTFSLHNLYYLNMFLRLIGKEGRKSLKSLRFGWTLPEEEARPLRICTGLAVDMDPDNLMRWQGSGWEREEALTYLDEFPYLGLFKELRGLKDVRFAWKDYSDIHGVPEWVADLIGLWRLPRGADEVDAVPVEANLRVSKKTLWHYIHWRAQEDSNVEI